MPISTSKSINLINSNSSGGGGGLETDDQTAAEVSVIPVGNLSSTTVQAALQELQIDIDNSSGGGSPSPTNLAVANITNNSLDITSSTGNNATISTATSALAGLIAAIDKTKLDGIETSADVTDSNNVGLALNSIILSNTSVNSSDLVLIKDVSDNNILKSVTAQSIADLGSSGSGTDDQTAFEVSVTPSGDLSSTNVQAALEELQTDINDFSSSLTILNAGVSVSTNAKSLNFLNFTITEPSDDVFNIQAPVNNIAVKQDTVSKGNNITEFQFVNSTITNPFPNIARITPTPRALDTSVTLTPSNYTATSQNVQEHLSGIDQALAESSSTGGSNTIKAIVASGSFTDDGTTITEFELDGISSGNIVRDSVGLWTITLDSPQSSANFVCGADFLTASNSARNISAGARPTSTTTLSISLESSDGDGITPNPFPICFWIVGDVNVGKGIERANYITEDETVLPNRYFETSSGMYKPMYKKVINIGNLPNSTNKSVLHGLTFSNLEPQSINLEGKAHDSTSSIFFNMPFIDPVTLSNSVSVFMTSTNLVIGSGQDRTSYLGTITITYAKVSDSEINL